MDRMQSPQPARPRARSSRGITAGITALVCAAALLSQPAALHAAGAPELTDARIITDPTGRTVIVPTDPRRIVTAGQAVLMVADALYLFPGAPSRIVGIGRIDQGRGNFLEALDPYYVRRAVLETNVGPEQVASLTPDLVILKSTMKERLGDGVELLGIPVVYVDLETPEQYQRDLLFLGELLGEPSRARDVTDYFASITEETAALARKAARQAAGDGTSGRPTVLFLYASVTGGETAFQVPPRDWIQTTIVELSHALPVWIDDAPVGGWRTVSLEQIAAWNPDVITLVAYRRDVEAVKRSLIAQPAWRELEAVRRGALHSFPVDFYSWDQPDVRWLLGLQWLTSILWPQAFPPGLLRERVYDFYRILYGMDRDSTDRLIYSRLGEEFR